MDEISRTYYALQLQRYLLRSNGTAFQDLFCSIMERRYPSDFIRPKPWGPMGDYKCDGFLPSKRTLFQCYAPNQMRSKDCVKKIAQDFSGALKYWAGKFDQWTFVHNALDGLGPEPIQKLLELEQAHTPVVVTHWGSTDIEREVLQLATSDLSHLFGPAPSLKGMLELGLEDLAPVIDQIGRIEPDDAIDVRPVPADKLRHNLLSDEVAQLLKLGMTRADLVQKYFKFDASRLDWLAARFNSEYRRIRATGVAPDEVFSELQRFAGGSIVPSPSVQNAVLAVLAFFFEECDIFERTKETPNEDSRD